MKMPALISCLHGQGISQYRNEIIAIVLLFSLALGVRLLYQNESVVRNPVRADAAKYYSAAYNLRTFGIYSLEKPNRDGKAPETTTDLSPGYPLFLSLFMREGVSLETVLRTQALLGTLTCVLVFLIARSALSLPWAFIAGILTALCPHLVAMDYYLLTESLFTFVMLLGTLLLLISWRNKKYALTLLASILLAFSTQVRTINLLFLFSLSLVFFFHTRACQFLPKSVWIKHLALVCIGFAIITGLHSEFVNRTVTSTGEAPKKYVKLESPEKYLTSSLRPLEFFVKGESHVARHHSSMDYKKPAKGNFWDHPFSYLKWNLGGKLFLLWHWDNSYNGDVYIYPMIRKGFEENAFLKFIHRGMRSVHWPLYLLSLAAPVVFLVRWRRKTLSVENRALLVPVLGFLYLLAALSFLSWLPRYTIPARPFSYILASASLSWLFLYAKNWLYGGKEKQPSGRLRKKKFGKK